MTLIEILTISEFIKNARNEVADLKAELFKIDKGMSVTEMAVISSQIEIKAIALSGHIKQLDRNGTYEHLSSEITALKKEFDQLKKLIDKNKSLVLKDAICNHEEEKLAHTQTVFNIKKENGVTDVPNS